MIKGIVLSGLIGIIAIFLSHYLSIGSVVLAIFLGTIVNNVYNLDNSFSKGINFSEKKILAFAIALLGIN